MQDVDKMEPWGSSRVQKNEIAFKLIENIMKKKINEAPELLQNS